MSDGGGDDGFDGGDNAFEVEAGGGDFEGGGGGGDDDGVGGDVYTETTEENFFERMKNSLCGPCIGILLIVIAIVLLFWNEGRTVRRSNDIKEADRIVVSLSMNQTLTIDSEMDGKLVYFTGPVERVPLKTSSSEAVVPILEDPIFGVIAEPSNALKLRRNVEMYQWKETKTTKTTKTATGTKRTTTSYSYSKTWSSSLIRSSSFNRQSGHTNPSSFPVNEDEFLAGQLAVRAFYLTSFFTSKINWYTRLPLEKLPETGSINSNHNVIQNISNNNTGNTSTSESVVVDPQTSVSTGTLTSSNNNAPVGFSNAILSNNEIYLGVNNSVGRPSSSVVGDVRIYYDIILPDNITIIGMQDEDMIQPYVLKSGREFYSLNREELPLDEVIEQKQKDNSLIAWVLRLVGLLLMFLGLLAIMDPLMTLVDIIPIFGDCVQGAATCVAFTIALVFTIFVIIIGWLTYHPVYAAVFVVVIGGAIYASSRYIKSKKKDNEEEDNAESAIPVEEADEEEIYVKPE